MQNKNNIKTIILVVLLAAAVVAAFFIGSFAGKKQNEHTNIPAERPMPDSGSQSSNSGDSRVSDSIFDLITAFDDYIGAPVQQSEVEIELNFGSLRVDEEFAVRSGIVNDIQISHIQRGKLDIYICDGKVFVEDDNAHFDISTSGDYDSLSMRQLFAVAYEIVQNGDFDVKTTGDETVYSLALNQQQIENILNSFQSTMEDVNVKIEKGVLQITLENGKLDELDVICSGYTQILSAQIDGAVSVSADLSVSQQPIEIPPSVAEQIK